MENLKSISKNAIKTSFDCLNAGNPNSLLTDLGLKSQKDSNAAYHLVPFLLKVLGIEKSELTDAISKSIVDLDDLAQQIDSKIDIDINSISQELNYNKFKNLELNIVECFCHLKGSPLLEKLITETLKCVNKSFKYNTIERHKIYNLQNTAFNGCTTFYLFPLVSYLFSQSNLPVRNERLFFLVSNYIQILDDYIDVFEDSSLEIKTPITIRYNEIKSQVSFNKESISCFHFLTKEIFVSLNQYLREIQFEAKQINKNLTSEVFMEWEIFHSDFKRIKLPSKLNEKEIKKYQNEVLTRMPQIVCYVA